MKISINAQFTLLHKLLSLSTLTPKHLFILLKRFFRNFASRRNLHILSFQTLHRNSTGFIGEYCGARDPWAQLVKHYVVRLTVLQVNVLYLVEMICTFEIISHNIASRNLAHLRTSEKQIKYMVPDSVFYSIGTEFTNLFWLLNAGHGYRVRYINLQHSHITADLNFFDGPMEPYHMILGSIAYSKRRENVTIDLTTLYFSSLLTLDIFRASAYDVQKKLLKINFKKVPMSVFKINPRNKVYRIHTSEAIPLQSMYLVKSSIDTFTSLSFHIPNFSGWDAGNCRHGGYIILKDKMVEQKRLLYHGPYCNVSITNDPLVSNNGLKHLTFGKERVLLLFYAYSPLYTIDLDIVIKQATCEGIINPIQYCTLKQNTEDMSKFNKLFFKGQNYVMTCQILSSDKSHTALIRIIINAGCIHVQQIHITHLDYHYHLDITGTMDVNIQSKNPFVYNKACHAFETEETFFHIGFSNLKDLLIPLQNNSNQILAFEDIISTQVMYTHMKNYHQTSYSIVLKKLNRNNMTAPITNSGILEVCGCCTYQTTVELAYIQHSWDMCLS